MTEDVESAASTVVWPKLVETVNETVQVPLASVVCVHVCCETVAPLVVTVTLSPWTPPLASVAVTVAVTCDWPSATMDEDEGDRLKLRLVAVPEACATAGIRQQQMSAARALSRIVVRRLILRCQQPGTAATKRFLNLTGYPASPWNWPMVVPRPSCAILYGQR